METIFDVAYLATVISLGVIMTARVRGSRDPKDREARLFGVMALVLGCGDAFHLVPRAYSLITDTMGQNAAALGVGKLVTSITMTVFYVLFYRYMQRRYTRYGKPERSAVIYVLAALRIALCLFPQNDWLSADAPLSWGIYRNIPFVILGVMTVILSLTWSRSGRDKRFSLAWLAVALSFAFYIPVVLWADTLPIIGMLMIPKTICYVWLVAMGYRAARPAR
jgi:hypothetical protein